MEQQSNVSLSLSPFFSLKSINENKFFNVGPLCPGQVAQLVGASCYTPKGCGLDSQSGNTPGLWVSSQVGSCMGGNQSMFLSLFLSSPFHSLSQINKRIYSWELKKNRGYQRGEIDYMTQNYLSEACMEQCAKMGFILWLFLFSILYYPCPPSLGIQALLYIRL